MMPEDLERKVGIIQNIDRGTKHSNYKEMEMKE